MKSVPFSSVAVGDWFKESVSGAWHLKSSGSTGMYQCFGTRYEPKFKSDETVFVD